MSERRKKKRLWIIPLCSSLIVASVVGVLIWSAVRSGGKPAAQQTLSESEHGSMDSGNVIWNGKEYEYNDHLSNYLLLGIDHREKTDTSVGKADAGQADAIYLISWDRVENRVTTISIPRDTMTEIEVFGPSGESFGKSIDHISLSYAYGDGGHESCRLAKEAVSELFYGLSIQGYCAVNMDGIPVLTESVGNLTVTVPNDSLEEKYPEFTEGTQVTLDKENTETFVRYRDVEKAQSALQRMERQKEFLRAFGAAAQDKAAADSGFAAKLYTSLEPYMVTSMGNDEFVKLMESAVSGTVAEGWTVPGKGVEGKSYDEYHVDDNAFYEKIIDTFYEEAE